MGEAMTTTLTAFLLARVDEDDAAARTATPGPWRTFPDAEGGVWAKDGFGMAATGCGQGNADHIVRHDPARVVAECEAKRQIVKHWLDIEGWGNHDPYVLELLALPYVDHPDYREEWRP